MVSPSVLPSAQSADSTRLIERDNSNELSSSLVLSFFLFFDPCVAICTLVRDSSLSLTDKISSAILPATAITRMNKTKQNEVETGSFEESIELRMTDLETQMTMFKTVFMREKEKNIKTIKDLEN